MTDLPTGTVTFLFTDIEGSTRLWERDAAAMQDALDRHDSILGKTIEGHGGHVFKTVGDAFCAVFVTAAGALEAALEAQRALSAEEWAESIGPLRVRMAMHTGAATERGGDYFGQPLNRVARLLAAAHGGQVLLSVSAQGLLGSQLPEHVELRDLGERRLKDLFRPERIFQLSAPGLPSSFPPLKTLDERLNNLPVQPTPLVGREKEVDEVSSLLRDEGVRLLTLSGPGGTGKTRLGLQVAAELLDEFEGGVCFVTLATIADAALVAPTVAGALGVREKGGRPSDEALRDHLRDKEMLLMLDNFEQVLDAAPLVGKLLASCPALKVLTTSRSVLRVYGEREYPVPAMGLPDSGSLPPVDRLARYAAVRLFLERARSVDGDFEVTEENAPAMARICVRLDGLPLAIELAAARVRLLPLGKILDRLESNRLKLLAGGARDLPERQQTLRGAIDWSYALLEEHEKRLFARLAVFSGGCTMEAMEMICDDEDAIDGATSLLDKSLLRRERGPRDEPRFVMLGTIHEYARERLEESDKAHATRRLHAGYFLALAEETEPRLTGPEQVAWFERLETENDNLRAALSWAIERGEAELGLRLARALRPFWYARGHYVEGRGWIARFLGGLGELFTSRGEYARAEELYEEILILSREMGDAPTLLDCLIKLGYVFLVQGNHREATALGEEAVTLSRERGYTASLARALNCLGWASLLSGDLEQATGLHKESLALYEALAEKAIAAESLEGLACSAGARGEARQSAILFGAAEATGYQRTPAERALREPYLVAARSSTDSATWEAAFTEGRSTTIEKAISQALRQNTKRNA
ncbi:LuxR family transcriptional regulator [soil metagenome]